MVNKHNAESELAEKPRRARPEACICSVANLGNGINHYTAARVLQLHASGHAEAAIN